MERENKNDVSVKERVLTIISTILCCILLPMLIINCTLIFKSFTNPDKVPDFGGYFPMIVLTDSMYPTIEAGDLIICQTEDAEEIEVEDIISFFDPAGNGVTVVTHKVVEIVENNGEISFRTKGDANNVEDNLLVPAESLIGIYKNRIPGAGNVAMFMQTSAGFVVCVGLPLVLIIGYDWLRRKQYDKKQQNERDELLEELRRLRQLEEKGDM